MGRLSNTVRSALAFRNGHNLDNLLEGLERLRVKVSSECNINGWKLSADLTYKERWIGTAYRHRFIESNMRYSPHIQPEVERAVREIYALYSPNNKT